MKKEVLLVLGIIEGRGWHPIDGYKTIIEANLDNHKLSTESFPLTNTPKFNTEITWEAEKQTIRSYKLNRIPIKIECYAIDDKKNRKLLGYIVLPLTSAVEGVEADAKWYKLLGGPATTYKTPPGLLLRLHLEAMTLDQQSGISNSQLGNFKNGQKIVEDGKMSYLLEKNKLLQNQEGVELKMLQTNGDARGSTDMPKQDPLMLQNYSKATNGLRQDMNDIDLDDMDDDEDEDEDQFYDQNEDDEMVGFYVQLDHSDSESNDMSDIVENFSPTHATNKVNDILTQTVDTKDLHKNKVKSGESKIERNDDLNGIQKDNTYDTSSAAKASSTVAAPETSSDKGKEQSEYELLMKTRNTTRENLHKLSKNLISPNCQAFSSLPSPATSSHDMTSPHEKRFLEISQLLSESCEQRNKTMKTDSSLDMSGQAPDANQSKFFGSKLTSHDRNLTSAALLLSKHVGETPITKSKDPTLFKGSSAHRQKLIPQLNQEGGFFSIGPREGEAEDEFVLSITIVYAKNLSKVISQETIPSLKEGYRFCYSLLGYSIYTDYFHDIDNPEFLAEKASALIRSSHQSLSQYFLEHYFLPVYLLNGETSLGVCRVDMGQLVDIVNKNEANVEGVYEMNSLEGKTLDRSDDLKAVVAISVELAKDKRSRGEHLDKHFSFEDSRNFVYEKCAAGKYNEIVLSDSMESDSEASEGERTARKKTFQGRFRHTRRHRFGREESIYRLEAERELEREKKKMLYHAAYEIERWKEQQQQQFLKECASKEESLQRLIASEWNSKAKLIEGELSERLDECDKLQEKLNAALNEMSVREEKLKLREKRVTDAERELKLERDKLETLKIKRVKESQMQGEGSTSQYENLLKQLQLEENKRSHLEKEVSRLCEELANSEENFKAQTQEVIKLRRKLIQSDDIIGISKEKEVLENKIESLLERKQYYKAQWQNALIDLHKIHSAHKRTIEEITSDPQPVSSRDLQDATSHYYTTACYKLRKLRDERKTLLNSGLYPLNHSIIKNIDKKIRDLLG